jgi:hypothetical protein
MVKAATAPFRFFANAFGGKEEDYKQVNFDYLQHAINESQKKTLDNLARVLVEKPELKLQLLQVTSRQDEAEAFALQQIKKQYLNIASDSINNQLQNRIDSLDDKDSLFSVFINSKLKSGSSFMSVQEKCIDIIGKEKTDTIVNNIMERRNQAVLNYLTQEKQIPASRLLVSSAKDQLSRGQAPKFVINIAGEEGEANNEKSETKNKE